MSKLGKIVLSIGGVLAFSEFCGIFGEAQALKSVWNKYPDEIDDCIEALNNPEDYGSKGYAAFKCKTVGKITKALIDQENGEP